MLLNILKAILSLFTRKKTEIGTDTKSETIKVSDKEVTDTIEKSTETILSPFLSEKNDDVLYPQNIKNYEKFFDDSYKDSDGTQYTVTMNDFIEKIVPANVTGYYYTEKCKKETIVLHFTVGFLTGDLATLIEQDSHMSVAFVVGRQGKVYQLFDSNYWSYHLGRGAVGGNTTESKRSIAIELSNIGPLVKKNDSLYNVYGAKYCSMSETSFYRQLSEPYRQYIYFATFTNVQYESLRKLIDYLCNNYNISKTFISEDKRYELFSSNAEANSYKGICSHVNYLAYGKVDIGPAFDWSRIT